MLEKWMERLKTMNIEEYKKLLLGQPLKCAMRDVLKTPITFTTVADIPFENRNDGDDIVDALDYGRYTKMAIGIDYGFTPKKGETYYRYSNGGIYSEIYYGNSYDENILKNQFVFRTKEEAQAFQKTIQQYVAIKKGW